MCGIIGFIEKKHNLSKVDIDLFETMLLVDSLRGIDSTGAFAIYGKSGTTNWIKQATNPLNLFKTKEWDEFTRKAIQSAGILVGHNRKATIGEINSDNAHPFVEGNTILIHNGGISNWRKFDATKKVDSHAIAAAIEKNGHEEILPELDGAYVLVWYNIKDKRLYFARNSQRPLWFAHTDMYEAFGSELDFLEFSLGRVGQKITKKYEFKEHTIAAYDLAIKGWYNTEYKPKPQSTVVYYSSGYDGYQKPANTNPQSHWYMGMEDEYDPVTPPFQVDKVERADGSEIANGMIVQLQVDSLRQDTANGRIKLMGKCISPDIEHCDVVAMTQFLDLDLATKMYPVDGVFQAEVASVNESVCGVSAWVKDLKPADYLKDCTGTKWSANTVRYLMVKESVCEKPNCSNKDIGLIDMQYSKITRQVVGGVNKYSITCPYCVSSTMEGQAKHDFEKNYLDAIQNGKPVNSQIAETTH